MKPTLMPDPRSWIREESEQITHEFEEVLDPEVVARCMDAAQSAIAAARVPDYTPIFFARRARRLLREEAAKLARAS
jgi:hypothetical protein